MTISEGSVAKFFTDNGFSTDRIPASTTKTPDFWISHAEFRAAVEVKEISENEYEKNARRDVEENGHANGVESRVDTKVLRNLIKYADSQLKRFCSGGQPGMLVVQDMRPFWTLNILIEESLKQAMFGDRVVWRSAPRHLSGGVSKTVGDSFGGNRTLTDQKNRSVSAVGILYLNQDPHKTSLSLYHNPFARHKLILPKGLSGAIREFAISSTDQYGHFERTP